MTHLRRGSRGDFAGIWQRCLSDEQDNPRGSPRDSIHSDSMAHAGGQLIIRTGIARAVLSLLPVALLSGCEPVSSEAGSPPPVVTDEFAPLTGEPITLDGTIVDPGNGCLSIRTDSGEQYWVIWPAGTRSAESGSTVRLADGKIVRTADEFRLTGQLQSRSALPDGDADWSMWGGFAGFCLGGDQPDRQFFRTETAEHAD